MPLHDAKFGRLRRHHAEVIVRDALDAAMRSPRALLELQLAPLDVEVVARRRELLQLAETVARLLLAVDDAEGGREHHHPQRCDQ